MDALRPMLGPIEPRLPPAPIATALNASVILLILSEGNSFYAGSAIFKILASLSFLSAGLQSASASSATSKFSEDGPRFRFNLAGIPHERYPLFMLLALGFSVLGDVLLIPPQKTYLQHRTPSSIRIDNKHPSNSDQPKPLPTSEGDTFSFKAGTFFFALAHISYMIAFLSDPARTKFRWSDFAVAIAFGAATSSWLGIFFGSTQRSPRLNVPPDMDGLVKAYVGIIATMVGVATATDQGWQKTVGAWMFMISDLFVASDVFGKKPRGTSVSKIPRGRPGWVPRSVGWIAYFWAQVLLAGCI